MEVEAGEIKKAAKILASLGGRAIKAKYPKDYFKKLGQRSAQVRWGKKKSTLTK